MGEMRPLTMSENDEREDRFAAKDKSGSGTCDPYRLECAWAEVDALRARVLELEKERDEAVAREAELRRLLTYVRDSGYSVENVDVTIEIDAAIDGPTPRQQATRDVQADKDWRRLVALLSEAYEYAAKGNDHMCASVLLADAGWMILHYGEGI